MKNWANLPQVEALVDEIPKAKEIRHWHKHGIWYGEHEGIYASFYYHPGGDINSGGFGGSHFTILDKDGNLVTLKGPWSSRSGVCNSLDFGPCVEATLFITKESYDRGYTGISGALTVEAVQEALEKYLPSVTLSKVGGITSDMFKDLSSQQYAAVTHGLTGISEPIWVPHLIGKEPGDKP